jgi:hypothetical protein
MSRVTIYVRVCTAGNSLYDFRGQDPLMVTEVQEIGFLHVTISNSNQGILTRRFNNFGIGTYDDQFIFTK